MRIYCKAEHHDIGGPGAFFLARSEKQLPKLISEYGGKVQLIYLDPPFGTGDTFQQHVTVTEQTYEQGLYKVFLPNNHLVHSSNQIGHKTTLFLYSFVKLTNIY